MVDDVLQDDDPARVAQHVGDGGQGRTVHRGERPAVQVVPGEPLEHGGRAHEHGDVREALEERGDVVEPLLLHQHRPRHVTRGERAAHALVDSAM